jgi:prevent-host-death family protein
MKRATITEAKNKLSALIDQVRHGVTVLIVDRDRPVARLEPVGGKDEDSRGRIARLERYGLVRRPRRAAPLRLIAERPPRADGSILRALLEEREEGR